MGRLYFDVSKWRRQRAQPSGLVRVSTQLQTALEGIAGVELVRVRWSWARFGYVEMATGVGIGRGASTQVLLTPEQFGGRERLGHRAWLRRYRGHAASIFYDAIPHTHPEHCWPRSVRRFPALLRALADWQTVYYISDAARLAARKACEALGYPSVDGPIIPLGVEPLPLSVGGPAQAPPTYLIVGILEWRKGHDLLLEAAERMWQCGHRFEVMVIGRANPHHGGRITEQIGQLRTLGRAIQWHPRLDDAALTAQLAGRNCVQVMPSRVEGFGLPVLEGLQRGLPVLCSALPVLENPQVRAAVERIEVLSAEGLQRQMERYLNADYRAAAEARSLAVRPHLPRWRDTVRALISAWRWPESNA